MPGAAKNLIRLLLAVALLATAVIRPPGAMLISDGATLTYTLCSGGELQTVTVPLEDEPQQQVDEACDFFARQIATLPQTGAVLPIIRFATQANLPAHAQAAWQPVVHTSKARGPPLMS